MEPEDDFTPAGVDGALEPVEPQLQRNQAEFEALTDISESELYAALCYVPVVALAIWWLRGDDPVVAWHVRQGLVITAGLVLAAVLAPWLPVVGSLLALLLLVVAVVALVQALQGRSWKIPGVSWLAERFKL